jgi:hypothetical protein
MERGEGSIHGVLRRGILRKSITRSSLSFPAMESQKAKERRRS